MARAHWRHPRGLSRTVELRGALGPGFEKIQFWDALDFVGISAYFPLDAPADASIGQLVAAWKPHRQRIESVQSRVNRPVLFLELGYRALKGAHQKPWPYAAGEQDVAAQAHAYEAAFLALADAPWWKGAYFWKTFTDPRLADARGDGTDFSFRGNPAEKVVSKWDGGSTRNARSPQP